MPTVKKLFLGLPIYSQVPAFFLNCLLSLQKQKPCEMISEFCQGDGIARSRNQLAAGFLDTDCTHLLFIDCDMIFHPDHVARLLEHDEPIVCGLYPKKQEGQIEWVINTLPGQFPGPDARGLQKVRYAGTGFMLIRRDVFEKMIVAYPECEFLADYGKRRVEHDFFPMGVYRDKFSPTGRYLSEDWFFCQRWLDMGGDILVDTKVVVKHIGTVIFPLGYQTDELFARCAPKLPEGFTRERYQVSDEEAAREVFTENVYQLPASFPAGSVVVDIGAHIGTFTAAALARGAAEIHAYEPDPENFEQLTANCGRLRGGENVRPFNRAVWRHGGDLQFSALKNPGDNKGEGSLFATFKSRPAITVEAEDINEVLVKALATHDRIAVLKLDCEGAEFAILEHADRAHLARIDVIAAELHTDLWAGQSRDELITILSRAGFQVALTVHPAYPARALLHATRPVRPHSAAQPLPEAPAASGDTGTPAEALAAGAPTPVPA